MRAAKHQTNAADSALATMWVFSGRTTIPEHANNAVKAFVKGGKRAVERIMAVRGHGHRLLLSDLERLLTWLLQCRTSVRSYCPESARPACALGGPASSP